MEDAFAGGTCKRADGRLESGRLQWKSADVGSRWFLSFAQYGVLYLFVYLSNISPLGGGCLNDECAVVSSAASIGTTCFDK